MRGRSDWIACARTRRGLAAVLLGQRATPVRQVANNTKMSEKKGGKAKTQGATSPDAANQKSNKCTGTSHEPPSVKEDWHPQHPPSRASMRAPNVTPSMKCTQSLSTVRQVKQATTKTKVNCRFHHAATQCKGSEQTKFEQVKHHLRPPKTRPVLLIGYLKDL